MSKVKPLLYVVGILLFVVPELIWRPVWNSWFTVESSNLVLMSKISNIQIFGLTLILFAWILNFKSFRNKFVFFFILFLLLVVITIIFFATINPESIQINPSWP